MPNQSVLAYTDYPLDPTLRNGEVLSVEVLSYDRNKYAKVAYKGQTFEVKSGYLFKDKQLIRRFPAIFWHLLPRAPSELFSPKIKAVQELRAAKSRVVGYVVYTSDRSGSASFGSLKAALSYLRTRVKYPVPENYSVSLVKESNGPYFSRSEHLLHVNSEGPLIITSRADRALLKSKTIRKIFLAQANFR